MDSTLSNLNAPWVIFHVPFCVFHTFGVHSTMVVCPFLCMHEKGNATCGMWIIDHSDNLCFQNRFHGVQIVQFDCPMHEFHHCTIIYHVNMSCMEIQGRRSFLGQIFCVLCFEICIPSLFSPSPLCSANFKTKHALNL